MQGPHAFLVAFAFMEKLTLDFLQQKNKMIYLIILTTVGVLAAPAVVISLLYNSVNKNYKKDF
jgi:hypothetical protein